MLLQRGAAPALTVLALALALVCLRLSLLARLLTASQRPDVASLFVVAAHEDADPARTPPGLIVLPGPGDYDGERFYRLALSPFTTARTGGGITLDHPLYRQQRLLYPLLAWALSGGGRPQFLPALLIGLNVLALAGVAGVAAAYARTVGLSPWWGVVPALYPGFALSLCLDTAEPLEAGLLLGALLLLKRGRSAGAALCLTLAVLTRETAVTVAGAALVAWLWPRLRRAAPAASYPASFFAVPLLVYAVWHLALLRVWGVGALHEAHGLVGLPGKGMFLFVRRFWGRPTPLHALWLAEMLVLAALGGSVLGALRASRAELFVKIAWVCYAGTALLLTRASWAGDSAFLRVLAEYAVLGLVVLAEGVRRAAAVPLSAALVAVWLAVAGHVLSAGLPLRHSVFETRRVPDAPQGLPGAVRLFARAASGSPAAGVLLSRTRPSQPGFICRMFEARS